MARSDDAVSPEAWRHVWSRLALRAGVNGRHRSLASLRRIKRGARAPPLTETLAPQSPTLAATLLEVGDIPWMIEGKVEVTGVAAKAAAAVLDQQHLHGGCRLRRRRLLRSGSLSSSL
jgi:hypothetical protein